MNSAALPGEPSLSECLLRVGRVMERITDLEALLLAIIEECSKLLNCEAASVALYDAEANDLVFSVASGEARDQIRHWRMPMQEGVVGWVAVQRQPLAVNDPSSNPIWSAAIDQATHFQTRNLAAVPMLRKGQLIGVLEVLNRQADVGFAASHIELLQLFADQASLAIENHRLLRARAESERLSAFSIAIADIGHNVKNIVMRMEFPVSLIDRALAQGNLESLRSSWPVMKRATGEIGALVREMLDYSKESKPEIARVEVVALAREALESCRIDAEMRQLHLDFIAPAPELPWLLDPNLLRAALQNLLGNAIEALAEHGGSRIELKLDVAGAGETLQVTVTDDGPGIPAEIQTRIFEPFFSTKKSKGTGLGLANVKRGVLAHGGQVTLDSQPGAGAVFTLKFPCNPLVI